MAWDGEMTLPRGAGQCRTEQNGNGKLGRFATVDAILTELLNGFVLCDCVSANGSTHLIHDDAPHGPYFNDIINPCRLFNLCFFRHFCVCYDI
jgi:hypothetical protein